MWSGSVFLSQTWESKLLFMQMGTPREELSPQQSSAQVVDSNIGNQQHSHLVSDSYFKGGGEGEFPFNR